MFLEEGHFLFTSSDTLLQDISFSHICRRMHSSATKHSEKANRRKCSVWNTTGSVVTCLTPWLFPMRYFQRFRSAAILYVIRSTIGYASCYFLFLNLISFFSFTFYRAMHFSAKRGIAIACRPSVCLSVRL